MLPILHELNPWWRGPWRLPLADALIRRSIFSDLAQHLIHRQDRRAAIVLGPRQAGKSTLVKQLIDHALQEGLPPQNILYADMEEDALRGRSLREVFAAAPVQPEPAFPRLVAFDEVHFCRTWAKDLMTMVDEQRGRFLLTGSAANELNEHMEQSLQGRYDRFRLRGLDFPEFLALRQLRHGQTRPQRDELLDYLQRGGFPEHATEPDLAHVRRRIREDVSTRAISHDIVARLAGEKGRAVRDDQGIRRLFLHLVEHPGARLNLQKTSAALGITHVSAKKWLDALLEAALFAALPPVTAAGRQARGAGRMPKIYPVDHGLVAAYSLTGDVGRRLEAVVHRHLLGAVEILEALGPRRISLGYLTTPPDSEVDFLLRDGEQSLAIEVTTENPVSAAKVQRLARALRSLRPAVTQAWLVCMEREPRTVELDGMRIRILPAEHFLLHATSRRGLWSDLEAA